MVLTNSGASGSQAGGAKPTEPLEDSVNRIVNLPPEVERQLRMTHYIDELDRELSGIVARRQMVPRAGEIWADRIDPTARIVIVAVQGGMVHYMPPHNESILTFRVDTCQELYEFAGEC